MNNSIFAWRNARTTNALVLFNQENKSPASLPGFFLSV
jgi:hypothetical protein